MWTRPATPISGATGADTDEWYVDGLQSFVMVNDEKEPELLGVAPMAGGTYLPGDPITVALVFDEIVDRQNSSLSSLTISTNVGTLSYAGGADTNVLYFTGKVSSTVSLDSDTALKVNSISNLSSIKDMCNLSGTSQTFSGGNTNIQVDATKPVLTVRADTSGSLPRHKATTQPKDQLHPVCMDEGYYTAKLWLADPSQVVRSSQRAEEPQGRHRPGICMCLPLQHRVHRPISIWNLPL